MNKVFWSISLFCWAIFLPGSLGQDCGSMGSSAFLTVQFPPAVCSTFGYGFTTTVPDADAVIVSHVSGVLVNNQDYCQIYAGSDNTGILIGEVLRGDVSTTLVVPGTQVFLDCQTAQTNSGTFVRIRLVGAIPSEKVTICDEAPYELKSPGYPAFYKNPQRLEWKFVQPVRSTFTFDFTAFDTTPDQDILRIHADGVTLAELQGSMSTPFSENIDGSIVTVTFLTTGTNATASFLANVTVQRSQTWMPIYCDESNITIHIAQALWECLEYENNDLDALYIAQSRDVPVQALPGKCRASGADTTFNFNLTECFASFQQNADEITATFKVWSVKGLDTSLVVQRYVRYHLTAVCRYNDSQIVNSARLTPIINQLGTALDPVAGEFQTSLALYRFSNFSTALLANEQIMVPDYVYGEARLDNIPSGNENFKLQINFCWATQMENSGDTPPYLIVDDGCEADAVVGEPNDAKVVIRNYMANYGRFKFKSFAWTNVTDMDQNIYVHCNLTICQITTENCPALDCSKRKKRSAEYSESRQLSFGPFRVMQEKDNLPNDVEEVPVEDTVTLNDNIINLLSLAILLVAVILCGCFIRSRVMEKHHYQNYI